MRTLFTTLCLVLTAFGTASAQMLRIGVRGGVNIADTRFDQVTLEGCRISRGQDSPGYQVALVTRLTIPKFLQIAPELQFTSHDYSYRISGERYGDVKISVKRLELPVIIGFNISAFRLFGGPVFRLAHSEQSNRRDLGFDVHYNDSDVALMAGAGFDIGKFFIDARYVTYPRASYNLFTVDGSRRYVRMKRNWMWQFSAGLFF